jgi:hypothetical protein
MWCALRLSQGVAHLFRLPQGHAYIHHKDDSGIHLVTSRTSSPSLYFISISFTGACSGLFSPHIFLDLTEFFQSSVMALLRRQNTSSPVRMQLVRVYDVLFVTLLACLLSTFTYAGDDETSAASQFSEPFVDQTTGLNMEQFFGARTSSSFAFATPAANTSSTSFIGQLAFPLKASLGWGAMGLTGDMEGNFILAAWPDGKGGVMASFRQATNEDNPPEVTGNFNVRPITDGTQVNATSLSYTFLCENCLDPTLGLSLDATGNAVMGWALSEKASLGDAADAGARLDFHERGFGPFTARLGAAATTQFEAIAATALTSVAASKKAVAAVAGSGDEGDDDNDKKATGGKEKDGDNDSDDEDDD